MTTIKIENSWAQKSKWKKFPSTDHKKVKKEE